MLAFLLQIGEKVRGLCSELTDASQQYKVKVSLASYYLKSATTEAKVLPAVMLLLLQSFVSVHVLGTFNGKTLCPK